MLDPNVSQGSSLSLSDHLLFEVASNSADAPTLVPAQAGTQLGDVSGVGKAYRGVLPLSHLSVRDNAQLVTQGDLLVWSGDPYGPGFAIEAGASLSARGLDVVSLQGPQDFDGDIFVLMCGGSAPNCAAQADSISEGPRHEVALEPKPEPNKPRGSARNTMTARAREASLGRLAAGLRPGIEGPTAPELEDLEANSPSDGSEVVPRPPKTMMAT